MLERNCLDIPSVVAYILFPMTEVISVFTVWILVKGIREPKYALSSCQGEDDTVPTDAIFKQRTVLNSLVIDPVKTN